MVGSDHIAELRRISDRMRSINERASERLVSTSAQPESMARAYAAINGELSGAEGMEALRSALLADGVPEEQIDVIDALYVRCLLDPSL